MSTLKMMRDGMIKKRILYCGAIGVVLISLRLALAGELDAMLAWWMAIFLLLPPLLWAFKTRYVALITICSIAFSTQFMTLPFFYLNKEIFNFAHVKPFNFTALEALPMLVKSAVFLYFIIIYFKFLYRISIVGGSPRNLAISVHNTSTPAFLNCKQQLKKTSSINLSSSVLYVFLIAFTIAVLAPLNLWMFSKGISIVGIEPPSLPYRLAGILHYFSKYIVPLALAYFYLKTKRGWVPMLLLLSYAWVLGLSSLSRSSLMFVMLPVLYLAWLDRRQLMFFVASFGSIIGFAFVSLSRTFTYVLSPDKSSGNFDAGIYSTLFKIVTDPDNKILSPIFIIEILGNIFDRIDGFSNLVMSQYYDSYQVIGPGGFVLNLLASNLVPMDIDSHHIQWQGGTLPEGFVNGGGLLSNAVILGNAGLWWILVFALVVASLLVLFEKSAIRLTYNYKLPYFLGAALIGFYSMSFFIAGSGTGIVFYLFSVIFIASWLPQLFSLDGQCKSNASVSTISLTALPAKLKLGTASREN